jgi:hypothetical protein
MSVLSLPLIVVAAVGVLMVLGTVVAVLVYFMTRSKSGDEAGADDD